MVVTWQDNSFHEAGYKIRYKLVSGRWWYTVTLPADAESTIITGLTPESYNIGLFAYTEDGYTSDTIREIMWCISDLEVTPGNDQVYLSWTNPSPDSIDFVRILIGEVKIRINELGIKETLYVYFDSVDVKTDYYTHYVRDSRKKYCYKLFTYNKNGMRSVAWDTTAQPFDNIPPAEVRNLKILDITSSSITLKWTNPQDIPEKDYWGTRIKIRQSRLTSPILDYFNNDEPFNKEVT